MNGVDTISLKTHALGAVRVIGYIYIQVRTRALIMFIEIKLLVFK